MYVHLLQTRGFVEYHVAVRQGLDAVEPAEEPWLVQAERPTRRTLAERQILERDRLRTAPPRLQVLGQRVGEDLVRQRFVTATGVRLFFVDRFCAYS